MVDVVVGRIGRAHGLRGEVRIVVLTDEPDRRFTVGARLSVQDLPGAPPTLTVRSVRPHPDLLVTFDEVLDRSGAEALRGATLTTQLDPDVVPEEPDAWYDHQLVGLAVLLADGTRIGTVGRVEHGVAQDLLVIDGTHGGRCLVPFVEAIVPTVDLAAGHLVLTPPGGLLDDLQPAPSGG